MKTALDLQTEFSYRLFLLLKNAISYCDKYIALAGAFCGFSPTPGKSFLCCAASGHTRATAHSASLPWR